MSVVSKLTCVTVSGNNVTGTSHNILQLKVSFSVRFRLNFISETTKAIPLTREPRYCGRQVSGMKEFYCNIQYSKTQEQY